VNKAEYRNILIIKPSALGDIVHTLPVLEPLKRKYPQAKITWLVRKEFASLIENHDDIDGLIIFDRKLIAKSWYSPAAMKELARLFKTLKKGSFDLVIDFQGLFRTALFAKITGCKRRIGMSNAREFANLFYTDKITPPSDSNHIVDYYFKILNALDIKIDNVKYGLKISSQSQDYIDGLLAEKNVEKNNYIAFLPGSAQAIKCWPAKNFAKLAEALSAQANLKIIAAGTASEKQQIENIVRQSRTPIINLAGQTNVSQLAALLGGAKMVIGNDTGPGHIAFAMGVPTIFIFGPSNPQRVAPYKSPQSIVAIDPDNRGSDYKSFADEHKIEAVSVELVLEKALQKLTQEIK
jgi:lipopolysaccharide heptosyltransferase I